MLFIFIFMLKISNYSNSSLSIVTPKVLQNMDMEHTSLFSALCNQKTNQPKAMKWVWAPNVYGKKLIWVLWSFEKLGGVGRLQEVGGIAGGSDCPSNQPFAHLRNHHLHPHSLQIHKYKMTRCPKGWKVPSPFGQPVHNTNTNTRMYKIQIQASSYRVFFTGPACRTSNNKTPCRISLCPTWTYFKPLSG